MTYSDTHKFIYLNTPKAGSSSLAELLRLKFGAKLYKGRDRHDNRIPPELENYFIFASVRHPFARAVSGYSYVSEGKDMPISEAFSRFHLISQADYLYNFDLRFEKRVPVTTNWADHATLNKRRLDGFVRVESLVDDFNDLPFVKKKISVLPWCNRGKLEYRNYAVDDQIWDRIKEWEDFSLFGYEKIRLTEPSLL